jgi:hypothetical protein
MSEVQRDPSTGRFVNGSREMHIEVRGKLLYHWVLLSSNGQVVATSETYFSKSNAWRAARKLSVAINVPFGRLEE